MFFISVAETLAEEWKQGATIQIESINKLMDDLNFLIKTLGGDESGKEILQQLGLAIGASELKGVDREQKVTLCVLLPIPKVPSELSSAVPAVVGVIPLTQLTGTDYLSAVEEQWGKPERIGNILKYPLGRGTTVCWGLALKIANGKCFLGTNADAVEYAVSNAGTSTEIDNALNNIQGSPKICIDMATCLPYIQAWISSFTNEIDKVATTLPDPSSAPMLLTQVKTVMDIISQCKRIKLGIAVKPNYIEILSGTDFIPGSKLEHQIGNLKSVPMIYLRAIPEDACLAYACSDNTILYEYTKPYYETLSKMKQDGTMPIWGQFSQVMRGLSEFYTGGYASGLVSDKNGRGIGYITISASKEPDKIKKVISETIKRYSDAVQTGTASKSDSQLSPMLMVKSMALRKHADVEIMPFTYSLTFPEGADASAMGFLCEFFRELKSEIAFWDNNNLISVIGTSELTDKFIDRVKGGGGAKLTDSSVFKSLFPQFKGDVVAAYYVSPVRLIKTILNSLPSINPMLMSQLPVTQSGIAGYSIVKDKSLLKCTRIDVNELKALKDVVPVAFMIATQASLKHATKYGKRTVDEPKAGRTRACMNNLRLVDSAKEQVAIEKHLIVGDKIDINSLQEYLPGKKFPVCPAGGVYSVNVIGTNPRCSVHGELR